MLRILRLPPVGSAKDQKVKIGRYKKVLTAVPFA